jgi:hypothetical protein
MLIVGRVRGAEDFLDRFDDYLAIDAFHGNVRAQVRGLLDLEGYYVQQPPPGLIDTSHNFLFNPRLTFFLDVQLGPKLYFFAQARIDRGFDPANNNADARLDEYALRYTPWEDGRINVQVGKFATVVGNWVNRHDSWDNPFVTAPLLYENITAVYAKEVPSSRQDFLGPPDEDKYEYNPVVWGPSYATGASVFGHIEKFDYAVEVKNVGLSSSPEYWSPTEVGFDHPTYSARLGVRPDEAWNVGASASVGPYLLPEAASMLPPGKGIGDYNQITIAQDLSYAWHHWQIWAEAYETRFEVPLVGNADVFSYYVEAKYKFTPQLFGAIRWNQQMFGDVPNGLGGSARWGSDIWRIDGALTYRFTSHLQAKLQYSFLRQQLSIQPTEHFIAGQITMRF